MYYAVGTMIIVYDYNKVKKKENRTVYSQTSTVYSQTSTVYSQTLRWLTKSHCIYHLINNIASFDLNPIKKCHIFKD